MNKFHFLLLLLVSNLLHSQTLTVSSSQLNFGNTFENSPDSIPLTITNPGTNSVDVNGIRFYTVFGSIPFSVRDSVFTLSSLASKTIYVKFSPIHNAAHNIEMVILNNSHRGNVSVDLLGQGKYSKNYYSRTENLSEQALKDTLQAITSKGYIQLGYNGARDKMFMNIDNKKVNGQGAAVNTLECVYTGRNAVGYINRSDCQGATYDFNTEHTFPQGFFSSAEPMVSDLFHLFPTDNTANNIRNSFRFGMVLTTPTWSVGGSSFATPFFESRDQHKGEVARAMFYFVVRYQNYQGFLTTQETTLRNWLHAFPPTTVERKRNTDINSFQKNFNPFIDYPQFVDRITSISNPSVAISQASIDKTDTIIDFGFINPLTNYIYTYVLVNNGNIPVTVSNLSLSNTSLLSFFGGTGSNSIVQPGEALNIKININTNSSDSLFEYFNFSTDLPNSLPIQVPVFANFHQLPLFAANPSKLKPELTLLPNPTSGDLTLKYHLNSNETGHFKVYSVLGDLVFSSILLGSEQSTVLNLRTIGKGVYTCQLQTGSSYVFKKLVIID